jgi:hypothetical protein
MTCTVAPPSPSYALVLVDCDDERSDAVSRAVGAPLAAATQPVDNLSALLHRETTRRVQTLTTMAYVQSLGGGWASVRNARKAHQCAVVLSRLAASVGDDATVRKCRVFEGYALMWLGEARRCGAIFERERTEAIVERDEINEGRCEAGMRNLLWELRPVRRARSEQNAASGALVVKT